MPRQTSSHRTDLSVTPAIFQILLALADEDRHGYGILREVTDRTGGEFSLGPGTLYRSIRLMTEAGLIAEQPGDVSDGDDRRRVYAITDRGREALAEEGNRLRRLVTDLETKRVLPDAGPAR